MTPPNDKQETELQTLQKYFDSIYTELDAFPTTEDILKCCQHFHKERTLIEQQAPAKTLSEYKDEVARSKKRITGSNFEDWDYI